MENRRLQIVHVDLVFRRSHAPADCGRSCPSASTARGSHCRTTWIGSDSQDFGLRGRPVRRRTVTLSTPALLAATVEYRVIGGTVTGGGIGVDYLLASGTLTFQPGETARTITIPIVADHRDEPDETLVLALGVTTA